MKPDVPVARREDYEIGRCLPQDNPALRDLIRRYHYTRSVTNAGTLFCARRRRDGAIVGGAVYLPPPRGAAVRWALTDPSRTIHLSRLVVAPGEPQNLAGMIIAASLRAIEKDGRYDTVITFADQSEGHTGTVYRATNAIACGVSRPAIYWVDPETGSRVSQKATENRSVAQMKSLGYRPEKSSGKYCFIWYLPLGSPAYRSIESRIARNPASGLMDPGSSWPIAGFAIGAAIGAGVTYLVNRE